MFTLRFISTYGTEQTHWSTQTCIECPHYEINEFKGGYTVVTFTDMTTKNGVERHITSDENRTGRYDVCYIMNSAGKTIDTLRLEGPTGPLQVLD